MVTVWIIFSILPILVSCTRDGNIHLMEEDVAEALRVCSEINVKPDRNDNETRQRRFDSNGDNNHIPRIDASTKRNINPYNQTRRNTNYSDQMHILNGTDYNYTGYGAGSGGEKFINSVPRPAKRKDNYSNSSHNYTQSQRVKRNDLLINKDGIDQCLSQCVFANLHMVDSKGIPREAEMWNRVQTLVTSEQSRAQLRDQIHACFQELQSESEDDECSYSNKLERCLMLRLSDRKANATQNNTSPRY